MKAIALSAILWLAFFGVINAQWQDDFSDGDFNSNPTWLGNTDVYSVAGGILQLNNTAASANNMSALYTNSSISSTTSMEWRFSIDQNFSGSDNNQTRVYITADGPITSYIGTGSAGVSGYFLLFGEALSNDVIRLYYDDGAGINLIASGTTSIASSFEASIRVTRDASANWIIETDFNGGLNYSTEAAFNDNSSDSGTYFGFINKYTTILTLSVQWLLS
jgi:hypothetical protein